LGIFINQTSYCCYYFQAAGKDFGSMGRGEGGGEGGGGGGGVVGVGAAGEGGLWINPLARYRIQGSIDPHCLSLTH
jgi:hypothetical protein